jgi:hypothetical protein
MSAATTTVRDSLERIQVRAASPRLEQGDAFSGLDIPWPTGLAPAPYGIDPAPGPSDALPKADVIVMVDTSAEAEAASDVLTPGAFYATTWYRYAKNFDTAFKDQFGPNAPANEAPYLGLYYLTRIAGLTVLVYKTNLHLHTDGKLLPDGSYTTPIKDMLAQMIGDAAPTVFLTTGTSGGVYCSMQLGDVAVTRGATFFCEKNYAKEPWNGQQFTSDWTLPTAHLATAHGLMQGFASHLTGKGTPPSPNCSCNSSADYPTTIHLDGADGIPAFHPVITTDFFEFGTSTNGLDRKGIAVEMDDAMLGLVCEGLGSGAPRWASVRNLSDPCITGTLTDPQQSACAGYYYKGYGYWTTVMSSLTAWGLVAGLADGS